MRKRKRTNPAMEATLQRVMDLRGVQRYYYYVHSLTVPHRWDHEDVLNTVQRELEEALGEELVELVSVRDWKTEQDRLTISFYFRIGPIPFPDVPLPVSEKTIVAPTRKEVNA